MFNYNCGLVSVSFRDKAPIEIIKAAKSAHLCCIEWGSDVHAPCNDLQMLRDIAAMQKEYGIYCSSYGTYFRLGVNEVSELESYINAAKILGTDILRLWAGNKSPYDYSPEEKDRLFADSKAVAKIAEEQGVTLCLECHNNTYTENKESALELMEYVSSPHFRMYWQPNQFRTFEENITYIGLLRDYIVHLHVFNWSGNEKYPLKDAIPTWQSYLKHLDGDRTLLLEFMPDNRIESLKTEAQALGKLSEYN